MARELRELPLIRDALADGRLHFSAVRELTRVANRETEAEWIAAADGKNLRQIERLVAGHAKGDLPEDPADPETMLERVTFELTPATIAAFRAMRKAIDDECGERLTDDQLFQIVARRALEPASSTTRASQLESDHPVQRPPRPAARRQAANLRQGTRSHLRAAQRGG